MKADLAELVAARAGDNPGAIAVESPEGTLTYQELYTRASAVAAGLAELGVTRETLVGTAHERSAAAIVAMLGIVLAGGAYVPLNPALPGGRLKAQLADSGVRIVLADRSGAAAVGAVRGDSTVLRTVAEVAVDGGSAPALPPVAHSPLAYVMYTSGSTGRPKGVLVEHRGVVRLAHDPPHVDVRADDVFLQMSALEFDASTWEIWGALLNGARVRVVDKETSLVPSRLAHALRSGGVTVAWFTSALCNQLVDEELSLFAPLRTLITGGDVLSPRHLEILRQHYPGLALHNGYGPTENTTFTTVHRIDRRYDGPIPIGKPIAGTTVAVLDGDRNPVAAGQVGELYTGGAGVARGYLGNEQLTREKFVVHGGERYYRTGDLVRMDADGVLHFHGRTDDQVKIRGYRVEIGEVHAALLAVPGVTDAHVRVVGDAADKRLAGYVVAAGMSSGEVRAALAADVPGHLVPDQLLVLDRLPLNPNGKVDARALEAPSRPPAEHTSAQHDLAELWGAVLDVDPATIDPDDSFLDIGGNSIRLGVLIGRISRRLGVQLTPSEAFGAPTLAGMTNAVAAANRVEVPLIPAVPAGVPADLHPQQLGMYALWQVAPDSLAYNIPVRVRISGRLDVPRLRAAFRASVDRHDALRMRIEVTDSGVKQVAADVTAELVHRTGPPDDVPAGFIRPFRLDEPPLIRGMVVPAGPDLHDLYLDAHHIALDGISLRTLLAEIFARYAGEQPAPPPVSFASAAQWAHDRPPSPADEAHWLAELSDAPGGLAMPTDRPRGGSRAVRGAVVRRELDPTRAARVDKTARRLGTTSFSVVLAAYTAALARISGQSDLVIGTPTAGRNHPDLDSVVGMLVSTVCLRARIERTTTLAELARQLGGGRRSALTHQDYPFELLVRRLGIPRDPSRNPVFDALFAYQDIDFYEFRRGGLVASVELLNPGTTRFDLNLQVHRRPDRMVLALEHATDLYDGATAEYLLDHCVEALASLTDADEVPVFESTSAALSVSTADFNF